MNKKLIVLLSPFIMGIFFLIGCVVSGFFVQHQLGLNPEIDLMMIFELIQLNVKNKIVIKGLAILIVFIIIPLFFILVLLFAKKRFDLYGNASLITDRELAESDLLKKGSKHPDLFIGRVASGKYKGKLIRASGNTPVSLAAGTREGKGVSFAIPNMTSYSHSIVCLDPKGELYEKTAGYRQSIGHQVFIFSPDGFAFSPEGLELNRLYSDKWNVMDTITNNDLLRTRDLTQTGLTFFPFTPDEIWNDSALDLFVTIGNYMFDRYNYLEDPIKNKRGEKNLDFYPSIPLMLDIQAIKGNYKDYFNEVLEDVERGALRISTPTKNGLLKYLSTADKTRQSIDITFNSALNMFNNPLCAFATSGKSSFNFNECRTDRITVYFVINPNNMESYKRLINLFFSKLIEQNMDFLPEKNPEKYKYQLLVLLDEFATLGEIPIIANSITHISGYNIRLALIYQAVSQLEDNKVYGEKRTHTILSSCDVQINYPPITIDSEAERLSKALGDFTYKLHDKSSSSGKGGGSTTRSVKLEKRALFLPQEIVEIGKELYYIEKKQGLRKTRIKTQIGIKSIIFKKRTSPIICDKIIYFDDPFFAPRVKFSEEVFRKMGEQSINITDYGIKMPTLIDLAS